MPLDSAGNWKPSISPKQEELIEVCQRKKFVLCNGPRYSGKSVGAYAALAKHAWSTNPGNITIITISQTVGMDSGVWQDIVKHTLPEWIGHYPDGTPWRGLDSQGREIEGGNFGMEWVRPPYTQNVSKKPTCEVSNSAGGVTTIQLDSLQNEDEVEDRFKPRRYSMIYVPELSTFHKRQTFDTWTECLRMIGLPESSHLFLGDSNPPDDSCWWMHDLWWDLYETSDDDLKEFLEEKRWPMEVAHLKILKQALARVDIRVEDNPFADPNHVALLKAKYAHNDELYRRYILGECVRTTSDSLFAEVFRPTVHVVGEVETKTNKDNLDMMYPEDDCFELLTTWDPGSSTNWAAHVVEKFFPTVEKYGPRAEVYAGLPCFKILEEVCVIGEDVDAQEFVNKMLEKMDFWAGQVNRVVRWRHWSDRSVFDMKDIQSGKYYHQIIHEMSGGRVALSGAEKRGQSVRNGVDLIRRLFWEDRLWLNNATCPVTIAAIKSIKKGKSELAVMQKGSPHKHPIDSLRYLLQSECMDELARQIMLNIRSRRAQSRESKTTLVTIPL